MAGFSGGWSGFAATKRGARSLPLHLVLELFGESFPKVSRSGQTVKNIMR